MNHTITRRARAHPLAAALADHPEPPNASPRAPANHRKHPIRSRGWGKGKSWKMYSEYETVAPSDVALPTLHAALEAISCASWSAACEVMNLVARHGLTASGVPSSIAFKSCRSSSTLTPSSALAGMPAFA